MEDLNIEVNPLGDGIEIHLPSRDLRGATKAGWPLIGGGIFGTLFMLFWIGTPISWAIDMVGNGGPPWFAAIFAAFGCLGLGGLYVAVKSIALGIVVLRNNTRCSIQVGEKLVVAREHFGWFSHKTKVKRDQIEQLFVLPLSAAARFGRGESEDATPSAMNVFASIFGANIEEFYGISTPQQPGKLLAMGYPQDVLEQVANAIALELNRNKLNPVTVDRFQTDAKTSANPGFVSVESLTADDMQNVDLELPADSQLEVVEEGDSVVYRIPARGLWRGSNGLFPFSILWNGFMIVFTSFFLYSAFFDANANVDGPIWAFVLFIVGFWAIGISMLVGAIYLGKQSAMIGVRDGLLFIERNTIFGTKWTEFTAEEIVSIEMASSNMEVNDVPIMHLEIATTKGKPVGMFSQLSNPELKWLAQQLRRTLGVDSIPAVFSLSDFDPDEPVEILASTDIEVQQNFERTTIFVPPFMLPGIFSLKPLGLIFAAVPFPLLITLSFILGFDPFFILFASVFTLMGIVMFLVHRFLTTRNFRIEVTDEELNVQVRGFLLERDLTMLRSEVLSVDVTASGARLNNQQLKCLRIKAADGKGISMMTGRNEDDLVYVAKLIHRQLPLKHENK